MAGNGKDRFIRQEYKLFRKYAKSGEEFTLDDLKRVLLRKPNAESWKTYWGKKWRQLTIELPNGKFKVRRDFVRLDPNEFAAMYRQAENLFAEYGASVRDNVLVFEFFMPLAHERALRASLDALFYDDELSSRIREIDQSALADILRRPGSYSYESLVGEAKSLIAENFGGYSISHVNGRFRASDRLLTRRDAADLLADGRNYVIDETTAVVRFIFPVGSSQQVDMDKLAKTTLSADSDVNAGQSLPNKIRGLLINVFVRNLVRTVRYEEEIWLLESGSGSRLWQLKPKKKDDLGNTEDLYGE
jgi:hypothetical protein